MSSYIRKLSYLYYYENGNKGANAGYAKLERRDSVIRFQMNIRFRIMDETGPVVYFYSKSRDGKWILIPLGNCQIKNHQLTLRIEEREKDIFPEGSYAEDIQGILLPLSNNRFFASSWTDKEASEYFWLINGPAALKGNEDGNEADMEYINNTEKIKKENEEVLNETGGYEKEKQISVSGRENYEREREESEGKKYEKEKPERDAGEYKKKKQISVSGTEENEDYKKTAENMQETDSKGNGEEQGEAEPDVKTMEWIPQPQVIDWLPIREEKITPELVFSVYPSLPGFLSCEKCIRIEPQDIGILPMESWFLASNSFLLHGYYNYNHLLLGWRKEKPEAFVLGVPGIYDRRERVMAQMFGFEEFCQVNGSMGYWYRLIEPSLRQENM